MYLPGLNTESGLWIY